MESILPILINTLFGAGGGWLGNMLKSNGLGMIGNLIAGGWRRRKYFTSSRFCCWSFEQYWRWI